MFNRAWLELALLMVLLGALFGQDALLLLAVLLTTLLPIAWLWQRLSLLRVTYERRTSEKRVFEGERVEFTVRLSNSKWLPLAWIRVLDKLPQELTPEERPLAPSEAPQFGYLDQRASLLGHERARWVYHIPCRQRGYFPLGPAEIRSGDVFGLFERKMEWPRRDYLIVYPRVNPIKDWGLPPKEPFGETRTRIYPFQDPLRIRGLREYRPDDAQRHIHWPSTARHGELKVKVYEPTLSYNWVLFLSISTHEQVWRGVERERAEQAIRLAASLAHFAAERKYAVGLIANGTWPDSDQRLKVLPGRDPDQLRNVLEALAAVSYYVASPIELLLRRESPNLPWGATLVVVTPLVTESLLAEMLRLQRVGRRLALVSLDPEWEPESAPGLLAFRAHPPDETSSAETARAETLWHNISTRAAAEAHP